MKVEREKPMTNKAYDFLYRKIVSCEYLPGMELSEKQLLETTGLGRTPLREALLILQRENLVQIFPRKGMRIAPFDEKQVTDLYMYRKLIEPAVAVQYRSLYPKTDLSLFANKMNGSGNLKEWDRFVLDSDFHTFLISITNNELLIETYHSVMVQQIRLGMYTSIIKGSRTPEVDSEQHLTIINSLLSENIKDIQDSITIHINFSLIRSLDTIRSVTT